MPVIKAKEEEKDALKAKCIEEVVPKVFGALIKQLEKNGGSHFAGSEVHNFMMLEIRECTGTTGNAAILYRNLYRNTQKLHFAMFLAYMGRHHCCQYV